MAEQLTLPGIDPPLPPTDRLFFALMPDAAAAARIEVLAARLRDEAGVKGKPIPTTRLHVTLNFCGNHLGFPEALAAELRQAAERVLLPPFPVRFDRVGSFRGQPRAHPFVLRGAGALAPLHAMRGVLTGAMSQLGLGRFVDPRFTPHLTLLYGDRLVPEREVEPIEWVAHEFVLIRSLLGQGKHVPLGRWPFRG